MVYLNIRKERIGKKEKRKKGKDKDKEDKVNSKLLRRKLSRLK